MATERFTLESIATIDAGRVGMAFAHALKRCEADCYDRPASSKERKIVLEVLLVPVCSDNGELDTVNVAFKVKDTVPTRQSATYNMKAAPGGLLFNELSPDDVHQSTLDDAPSPRSTSDAG